jgi:hypothetical protein
MARAFPLDVTPSEFQRALPTTATPEPVGAERRAHRRAPLDVPAMLDASSAWRRARCRNVCAGGVALSVDQPFSIGSIVEVYFELPIGVSVETKAEVVRADGSELALRFVDLDRETSLAIRSYCRRSGIRRIVRRA